MSDDKAKKALSRRDLLKGAAVGAGALALSGIMTGETGAAAPPKKWDKESDVVIIGFGGAGAAAAIAAKDAGSKVLVLEKLDKGGGNSAVSAGAMAIPDDLKKGIDYMQAQTFGTVDDPEMIKTFVQALMGLPGWLRELGADIKFNPPLPGLPASYFPKLPGADSITGRWRINPGLTGQALWQFILGQVTKRKIEILYNTPVQRLVQNPTTGEIQGVIAKTAKGTSYIKARKAVVICCGGYENNAAMKAFYNFPGVPIFPNGSPGNTGDGFKMVSEVGAQIWHTYSFEWSGFGLKKPSESLGVGIHTMLTPKAPFIFSNKAGKRFQNEAKSITHTHETLPVTHFSHDMPGYPNIPFFAIFDETMRTAGPVAQMKGEYGYAIVHKVYDWSKDNQAEIDKGWIIKGNTLRELAEKVGIDPTALEDTVARYNKYCEAGDDPEFKRVKRTLVPLKTPPFYAAEICLLMLNTMGGAKRNSKAQVLDYDNKPIPRLYSAGEFGSIFGIIYQGGQNLPEAYSFGRIAGLNAAALKPWKK